MKRFIGRFVRARSKRKIKLVKGERSDEMDAERAYNEQLLPRGALRCKAVALGMLGMIALVVVSYRFGLFLFLF